MSNNLPVLREVIDFVLECAYNARVAYQTRIGRERLSLLMPVGRRTYLRGR